MKKILIVFLFIVGCTNSVNSKYVGSHNGRWEGYLLNQYNQGNAQFTVQKNEKAELRLSGEFNTTHKGQIKNDKFVTNKNQSCPIVDQGDRFKIVLIWTGVNVDVLFQK